MILLAPFKVGLMMFYCLHIFPFLPFSKNIKYLQLSFLLDHVNNLQAKHDNLHADNTEVSNILWQ